MPSAFLILRRSGKRQGLERKTVRVLPSPESRRSHALSALIVSLRSTAQEGCPPAPFTPPFSPFNPPFPPSRNSSLPIAKSMLSFPFVGRSEPALYVPSP